MKDITNQLVELAKKLIEDAAKDNKAAHARVRKDTLQLSKLGKEYRRISLEQDGKK